MTQKHSDLLHWHEYSLLYFYPISEYISDIVISKYNNNVSTKTRPCELTSKGTVFIKGMLHPERNSQYGAEIQFKLQWWHCYSKSSGHKWCNDLVSRKKFYYVVKKSDFLSVCVCVKSFITLLRRVTFCQYVYFVSACTDLRGNKTV